MMSTTTLLLAQQQQKKQDEAWDGNVGDYYGNMFVIPRESQNTEYLDEYHDMGGLGIYSDNNLQFNFDMLQLSSPQQQQHHHRRHTMSEGEELPLPIFHNSMKDFATLHHPLKTVNPKEIINSFPDDDTNQKNKTDFWMMQGEAIGAIATWLNSNDELKQELTPPLEDDKHIQQPQPVVQPPAQHQAPEVIQQKTVSVSPRPVPAVPRRKRGSVSIPLKPTISRRKRTKSMDLHTPHHSPLLSNVSFTAIDDIHAPTTAATTTTSSRATSPTLSDDMEKQFQCQHCTKKFRRSEHLKRHNRSVHSNDRPFHCSYCDKKFSRSDNLSQHLRTHRKD